MYRKMKITVSLLMTLLLSFMLSQGAFAHAVLKQASPTANSQLQTSPAMIELTFNERLEKELYFIHVHNQSGQQVTEAPARMSTDQTTLSLELPSLKEGNYTVTYHVISDDGHPVEKSYVFSVGVPNQNSGSTGPPAEEHQHGSVVFYILRFLYYLSLLFLTGWLFWGICYPHAQTEVKREYDEWLSYLKHFYLLMMVGMGFVQFSLLLSGFGLSKFYLVLTGTSFGLTWMGSLLLYLLGLFILRRKKWIDGLWIVLLLSAKGLYGHAISFHPPLLTVLLDVLHLVAASIWIGGLLILVLIRRKYPDLMASFLLLFSKWAFISILTLVITGVFSTSLFIPKWRDLLYTTWGYLLIMKIVLVTFIVVIAIRIRLKMKEQSKTIGTWLKWDFTLMLILIGVVSGLTYQSPIPANQPLYWHQMDPGIMVTTQITPNVPGNNQFNVELSLSKKNTQLKQIELFLKNKDKGIAPIPIQLRPQPAGENQGNFGLQVYRFTSEGSYLSFAGDWTIEVRILDSNDDETVYTKDFTLY